MRDLLRFIVKHNFIIIFLLLELSTFSLIVNYNSFQRAKIYTISQGVSGNIFVSINNLRRYFSLNEQNKNLVRENTRLRNLLKHVKNTEGALNVQAQDTISEYEYIAATVINNSVNKQYNFLTLHGGENREILDESAVICNNGVVGITKNTSDNYTTVISVLNRNLKISAKIKSNNYFGVLEWDGKSPRYVYLYDIPHHVRIQTGDSIVTSGYSAIFPEGIFIGTIADFSVKEGNFYKIKVALGTNFKSLQHVYVIKHNTKEEIKSLESVLLTND